MSNATIRPEEITAQHAEHAEFTAYCGTCKFNQLLELAAQPGQDSRYQDIRLYFHGEDYERDITSRLEALRLLQRRGFIETYWNWHRSSYSGGRVNYGTQHLSVSDTFRNPATGQSATMHYNETREAGR